MWANLRSKIASLTLACRRFVPPAILTSGFGTLASPSDKRGGGELILVVDDFQDAREMYAEYLEYAGYRVAMAANGAEAVEKALSEQPEAILMDLSMPLLNGCDATRILKADERTREIPVLALSGHEISSQQVKDAKEAGCDDFLPKPCPPEDVEQRIRRLLRGRGYP
jgi:two-component system, cell cycle response regulator DivK